MTDGKISVKSSAPSGGSQGDIYYNSTDGGTYLHDGTSFNIIRRWNDGSSATNAATDANSILALDSSAPDGDYWIKPLSSQPAFLVHCYMTLESGGWMKLLSCNTYNTNSNSWPSAQTNGDFLTPAWQGWNWAHVDDYEGEFTGTAGNDQFTPIYHSAPFNDVMIIATGNFTSNRVGWRHNTQYSSVRTRIATTNAPTFADSVLFGNQNLLDNMRRRSDTNNQSSGSASYGFKLRADTGTSGLTSSWYVGGTQYGGQAGHGVSMIGVGRENSTASQFGGGFGFAYHNGTYFKFGGHWWDHGWARNQGAWASDSSAAIYDHAVYVRKIPT